MIVAPRGGCVVLAGPTAATVVYDNRLVIEHAFAIHWDDRNVHERERLVGASRSCDRQQ